MMKWLSKMRKNLPIQRIQDNTSGVVGIVATVLVIGLLITFVGIMRTVYVPNWLAQKEAQHMNNVQNQFTELKYTLDVSTLLGTNIAISNYITLGSEELPFFNVGRTFDTLGISSDDFRMNVSNATDSFSFSICDIFFSSRNTYFVNQELCLEAGALILSQSSNSILLGQPITSVQNFTNVSMSLLNVSGLNGKTFVSGYGTYVISNEFTGRQHYTMLNVTNIKITTAYPEAWRDFFNSSCFVYSGLNYSMTLSNDTVHLAFHDSLGNFDFEIITVRSEVVIWKPIS